MRSNQRRKYWLWGMGCGVALLGAGVAWAGPYRGRARLVDPDEGRKLNVLGETLTVKVESSDTGGDYFVIEESTPPGGGPPPHVHADTDEVFYVVSGDVEFMVGGEKFRAEPGSTGFIPRGTAHTFTNLGDKPSSVLVFVAPGGFLGFFEEIDARSKNGPPLVEEVIEIAARYGMTVLPPPDEAQ